MGFEPVILWTDAFIYLLLLLITVTVWHTRQHEHLAAPWRRVASSRVGQVSMVVLAFYVVIGLLDTLHYHP
jgi:peptide/nickel transport system permease protein